MELQTPRLVLRSFRREDVDAMAQLFAYPDFMRFSLGVLPNPNRRSLSSRTLWAGIAPGIPSQFALIPRGENAIVGYCGVYHPAEVPGDIDIGRGLITETARAVRNHGFHDRRLSRVISLIHPENIPSRRVAEKNGMAVEKQITFRGFPTLVYAMAFDEWLAWRDAS